MFSHVIDNFLSFLMYKIEHFFIILEIIQYPIFTKLVAITDNEIFHDKGEEFLSTIKYLYRFLSRERNTIIIYILYVF